MNQEPDIRPGDQRPGDGACDDVWPCVEDKLHEVLVPHFGMIEVTTLLDTSDEAGHDHHGDAISGDQK